MAVPVLVEEAVAATAVRAEIPGTHPMAAEAAEVFFLAGVWVPLVVEEEPPMVKMDSQRKQSQVLGARVERI